jgi:ribokinase
MDVIGVGDIDVDIYLHVDHIPSRDEKVSANDVGFFPGGMVANFLVALRRLGTTCAFHGPVGVDEFGGTATDDLIRNRVDTSKIIVKPGKKTYFCVVMLDESGEKALVVAPTDCIDPEESDISEDAICSAKHLHTTFGGPAHLKAIEIAHRNGLTVSADFEPSAVKGKNVDESLAMIDVAFINQNALALMSAAPTPVEAMTDILSRGPKIVCTTFGKKGSLIMAKGRQEPLHVEAFDVPVVDTTGAGDCYAAGFVHGLLRGWPLESIGLFASASAALNVCQLGGHAGAPSMEQVLSFLENRNITLHNLQHEEDNDE